MKNRCLAFVGCLLFSHCALAEQVLEPSQEITKTNVQTEFVDLNANPVFQEAYENWIKAESVGEELDPVSVIWALSLENGTYLDVSRKLASKIKSPDKTSKMHWALPDIISILLVANKPEQAKPWIQTLREFDNKLLVPLYPLFAATPGLEIKDVDEAVWKNYQTLAHPKDREEHIKAFQALMANRDNYTHDQLIVKIVQKNLLP